MMTPRGKANDIEMNAGGSNSKGHKRGEKLQAWGAEELRVLIAYARKKKDQFGVSGNKLWELAERENILPGRTMQSMRECAKRKRAIIERDFYAVPRTARMNIETLQSNISLLCKDSGQSFDSVCWALYQCNGEFKRACRILYGRISMDDFHPWSCDEDSVIAKYARGLVSVVNQTGDHLKHIVNIHNVEKESEATSIQILLSSRDMDELAARASFLSDVSIA